MGSPDGPIRALDRDAWISISATRPCLRLLRSELGEDAPRRRASSRRTTHGSAPVRADAPGSYWLASACSRMRSSRSLSSGVSSSPKSSGLEHLADLDLGLAVERVGAALDPLDRLFPGLHLDQPVARDQAAQRIRAPLMRRRVTGRVLVECGELGRPVGPPRTARFRRRSSRAGPTATRRRTRSAARRGRAALTP